MSQVWPERASAHIKIWGVARPQLKSLGLESSRGLVLENSTAYTWPALASLRRSMPGQLTSWNFFTWFLLSQGSVCPVLRRGGRQKL